MPKRSIPPEFSANENRRKKAKTSSVAHSKQHRIATKRPRGYDETLPEKTTPKSPAPKVPSRSTLKKNVHSPLTQLISLFKRSKARDLIIHCADDPVKLVNEPNLNGHTPLMVAFEACLKRPGRETKIMFDLLERGPDLQQLSRSIFSTEMLTPMQAIENLANHENGKIKNLFRQMEIYCKDKPNIFDPRINQTGILSNELNECIKQNRTEDVISLLKSFDFATFLDKEATIHSVNQPDGNGCTPLMHALELQQNGRTDIIKILLAYQASPFKLSTGKRFSDSKKSPLTRVKELLASKPPMPTATYEQFQNYLTLFEQAKPLDPQSSEVLNEELSKLDTVSDNIEGAKNAIPAPKTKVYCKETSLTSAIKNHRINEVSKLLKNTPPKAWEKLINEKNGLGRTPLMMALESLSFAKTIKLLLENGANLSQKSTGLKFEGKKLPYDYLDDMISTTNGKEKQTYIKYKTLLDESIGAKPIEQIITAGRVRNPLTIAICKKDTKGITACFEKLTSETEITPLLLANDADSEGTPLMHVLQHTVPPFNVVLMLLQKGANPNLPSMLKGTGESITPSMYVNEKIEEYKNTKKQEVFLKCKAAFESPSYIPIRQTGNNELVAALITQDISVEEKPARIIEILSKFDPDQQKVLLNLPNYQGRSPLMIAVETAFVSPAVIEILIQYGADVSATSATRRSSERKHPIDCITVKANRKQEITDIINQARSALATSTVEESHETVSFTPQFKNHARKQPRVTSAIRKTTSPVRSPVL